MNINRFIRLALCLIVLLSAPETLKAQTDAGEAAGSGQNVTYSQQQLDQLLAPIALYPDELLSQILMGSTYPLEVVEADRWRKKHPALKGGALEDALKEKSWDVSVKSLCQYPRILATMSDRLDDTQMLGNAFLSQQDQVMNTIQNLRAKARAAGNLESTDKRKVVVADPYISIEPAAPEVIYVPAYDPCWVYGPWWYPACAPLWFWWPDVVFGVGFFWGPPIFIGPFGHWCGFFWDRHRIFVNWSRTAVFGRPGITRMHGGIEVWNHDPVHRRGVFYSSPAVARQFGQTPRPGIEARRAFRGFSTPGGSPARSGGSEVRRSRESGMGGPGMERQGRSGTAPGQRFQERGGAVTPSTPRSQSPRMESAPVPRFREGGGGMAPVTPRTESPRVTPFEGFGRSGSEVGQHSQRGFESMGGGFRGGGDRGGGFGRSGGSRGGSPGRERR